MTADLIIDPLTHLEQAGVQALLPAGVLTVDFGQDAELNWLLPGSDAVAQVNVQKRLKTNNASPEYIGSYSKRHGPVISDLFQGRVEWGLPSTSAPAITIKNVTWSDEACYICTFNVYTTGSQIQKTCLSVQGISNITMDVKQTKPRELVVSCAATGKPVPNISWDTAGIGNATETPSLRVQNTDTTVTVSSELTLVLPASADSVGCLVDGGSSGPRREQILLPLLNRRGDKEVENGSHRSAGTIPGIILSLCSMIAIAIVALMVWKGKKRIPFKQQIMSSSMLNLCLCGQKSARHMKEEMEFKGGTEIV
ncbi:unnamed protein product [Boreogadus saida]